MSADSLGFTKQTETLLCGLGAKNLIHEFEKRNISTDALHKLTKEDFVVLGANEEQAENMVKALYISKKKNQNAELKPHHRMIDKIEILKLGEKQLDMIKTFMTYCRLRLKTERINIFVEPDKPLTASQILCFATDSVLNEINEAELKLQELQAEVAPSQQHRILYWILFGGFCITTSVLFIRFWK